MITNWIKSENVIISTSPFQLYSGGWDIAPSALWVSISFLTAYHRNAYLKRFKMNLPPRGLHLFSLINKFIRFSFLPLKK